MRHPLSAADQLDVMIEQLSKKKVFTPYACLKKASVQAEQMRKNNDWSNAKGRHLVAVYAWLYEVINKSTAVDMDTDALFGVIKVADKMLKKEFGGDGGAAIKFIGWCWDMEKYRLAKNPTKFPFTWQLQFLNKHIIAEYRDDMMKRNFTK